MSCSQKSWPVEISFLKMSFIFLDSTTLAICECHTTHCSGLWNITKDQVTEQGPLWSPHHMWWTVLLL